jgi:Peptidase_C39 like family
MNILLRKTLLLTGLAAALLCPPSLPAQFPGEDTGSPFLRRARIALDCPVDDLLDIPKVWALTPAALEERFKAPANFQTKDGRSPFYQWLTTGKDRAHFARKAYANLEINYTLFGGAVAVEEINVDFLGGKLAGITFSLANRGDTGEIDPVRFRESAKRTAQEVGARLTTPSYARKANAAQGLLVDRLLWNSPRGLAVLENNPEAAKGQPEFLRLRVAPRDTRGLYATAMQDRASAMRLSELPVFVKRDAATGDVGIQSLPMVDQGPKGYCVVASAQRLFEYYGVPCDQHQLAQAAGSDAVQGTSGQGMVQSLEKIDHRFRMNFRVLLVRVPGVGFVDAKSRKPVERTEFLKLVKRYVDQGIPLLWGMELGVHPEEPNTAQQNGGAHMRLITGYNEKTSRIFFTDSWGAGHERKAIRLAHAEDITFGLFVMHPTTR